MGVGQFRDLASARSAPNETFFDQERFIHFLHRAGVLADRRGDGRDAHRTALKLIDDGGENFVVDLVEPETVDVEGFEGKASNGHIDAAVAFHLRKVAHAAQQGIGDTRRAARTSRHFGRRLRIHGHTQNVCRSLHDVAKCGGVVVFQVEVDAETRTKRCGEQTAARGGTHQREGVEVDLNGARRRPFVDHDVDPIVLHCRIQVFFHHRRKPVDLVDEQHVVGLQGGEQSRQVAGLVEHRAGSEFETHPQLVGDDIGKRRLAQPRRTVQQGVVERFAATAGGFHKNAQIVDNLGLTGEIVERKRAQGVFKFTIGRGGSLLLGADVEGIFCHKEKRGLTIGGVEESAFGATTRRKEGSPSGRERLHTAHEFETVVVVQIERMIVAHDAIGADAEFHSAPHREICVGKIALVHIDRAPHRRHMQRVGHRRRGREHDLHLVAAIATVAHASGVASGRCRVPLLGFRTDGIGIGRIVVATDAAAQREEKNQGGEDRKPTPRAYILHERRELGAALLALPFASVRQQAMRRGCHTKRKKTESAPEGATPCVSRSVGRIRRACSHGA